MIKNCYIHIPFCSNICSYCDFCKLYYNKKFVKEYLKSLKKEIEETYNGEVLDTIYIGGGTPSCLDIEELKELFDILSILKRHSKTEYTIEGNFESTTLEKLRLYKENGINRLSFGIETTNNKLIKYLERDISKEKIEDIISKCISLNLDNINVDLIYALKDETIDDLDKDLDYILSLNIKHISTYSLIIEEHTKLFINHESEINEDLDYAMYKRIINKLRDNNFIHYEISNFSKEGYESKHNLCYWNNDNYYGFGLGASSYIDNKRITNTRSFTKYREGKYKYIEEVLSIKDTYEYEIMLNLRKKEGISFSKWNKKYHNNFKDLYDYSSLLKDKLLIEENNHLLIPEDKWYISNEIIIKLLGCEIHE